MIVVIFPRIDHGFDLILPFLLREDFFVFTIISVPCIALLFSTKCVSAKQAEGGKCCLIYLESGFGAPYYFTLVL